MTAEPIGHIEWAPDPVMPRKAGHTVDDVPALPDDAPPVELSEGIRTVVRPPSGHLVNERYDLVADSAGKLILERPFKIQLPIRELAP